jgi:hypothetical protein
MGKYEGRAARVISKGGRAGRRWSPELEFWATEVVAVFRFSGLEWACEEMVMEGNGFRVDRVFAVIAIVALGWF